MNKRFSRRFLPLTCLLAVSGCAWFSGRQPADQVAGVASPTQRINDLRKLAKEASSADEAKRLLVAQQLSQEIQKEQDPLIRSQIVRTLGYYPGVTSDAVLRAATSDTDPDVRLAACDAWGKRGTPEAAQHLSGVLAGDIDRDVRMSAARNLGQTRQQVAVAALGTALDDKDPAMQFRAVASLREVTGKNLGNSVEPWREYVKSVQPPVRPEAVAERPHPAQ